MVDMHKGRTDGVTQAQHNNITQSSLELAADETKTKSEEERLPVDVEHL
jgi:hypothetical protein